MTRRCVLGVDIGTSSSKGVLVTSDGEILRTAVREHLVSRPRSGHVEMDARIWWDDFTDITKELLALGDVAVTAVGVSGMGPCLLLTDADNRPIRPGILYGVDTRAGVQIDDINTEIGSEVILERCGSALTSQAVGPKIRWIADNEPELYPLARRLFMPSSWLAFNLTGQYVLDYHSASQCTPLFDPVQLEWIDDWAASVAPGIALPPLAWPGEAAGHVTAAAGRVTGLAEGIPVTVGTIDAWTEALSVGAHRVGDLMLMYGTTMFLVNTVAEPLPTRSMWGTVGALPGTHSLAGGMATSGAITGWLRDFFGSPDYAELLTLAERSGVGARGLLMLPYFAGERTPIMDPEARGVISGLTISHTEGDLYRAALEATAFGIRHNVETMRAAGALINRVVAVGGGAQGKLWTQIVSDATGLEQVIPTKTIGASYGAAFLAASLEGEVAIDDWNPVDTVRRPDGAVAADYDELYGLYRSLYTATADITHALAARQHGAFDSQPSGPDGASTHADAVTSRHPSLSNTKEYC